MSRSTSSRRDRSLSRWMGSNKLRMSNAYVPSMTKSAAILRSGRISRKYKKRSRFVFSGVTKVIETSMVAADAECLYIGHASPLYQMKYCAYWALIKRLFVKAGGFVQSFADAQLLQNCGSFVGDLIRIVYKQTSDSAVSNVDFSVTAVSTVNNIVDFYANNAALNGEGVVLFDIRYIPINTPTPTGTMNQVVIRLEGTYVCFDMKYDLKLQNRTITAAGEITSENVTNAPIYGKSYFGSGIGPRLRHVSATPSLSVNVNTGLMVQGAASFVTGVGVAPLSEPLDYQYFSNVSKVGKIHIDAGQMKTSLLRKKNTFSMGNFLNMVNPQLNDAGSTVANGDRTFISGRISNYRMFAVEKMLDANPAGALTNVTVALEHNVKISAYIKEKPQNSTSISFTKFRI